MLYSLAKNLFRKTTFIFSCFCIAFLTIGNANAETLDLRLEISTTAPARLIVSGKFSQSGASRKDSQTRWLFLDNYADAVNLSRRFSKQEFSDSAGKIANETGASNEFVTARPADAWKYEVNLEMPTNATAAAHVSWLAETRGLLMLADLLPQFETKETVSALVKIRLPAGWKIATVENKTGDGDFTVTDVEKAVFLVGKDFAERTGLIGKTEFRWASEGNWQFSSDEAMTMASQILEEHRRTFGEIPINRFQLILLPLPPGVNSDRWRAETRGATIVLMSGVIGFKSIAANRLHEQLRHEIFHFWIPNGLNLSGNYDWFYEGFTLYQALKTGVSLNYIRFEDFLDALSRAFDQAQAAQSRGGGGGGGGERWRGGANLVYAKGMIVAFLCDAVLLNETGGKDSLSDVFRDLYRKHNFASARTDGNTASLAALKKHPRLAPIAQSFIENSNTVELKTLQELSGLVNLSNTSFTKLAVSPSLSGRQKKVLEKLGYKRS